MRRKIKEVSGKIKKSIDMKREVKFRGKRVDNGEWVYGFYTKSLGSNCVNILNSEGLQYTGSFAEHEVFSDSVGEFTNKHTKDGNEVFEGDKLSEVESSYWLVKWSEMYCSFHCYQYVFSKDDDDNYSWKKSEMYPLGHSLLGLLSYNYKIIGNIHDSKDLLAD